MVVDDSRGRTDSNATCSTDRSYQEPASHLLDDAGDLGYETRYIRSHSYGRQNSRVSYSRQDTVGSSRASSGRSASNSLEECSDEDEPRTMVT